MVALVALSACANTGQLSTRPPATRDRGEPKASPAPTGTARATTWSTHIPESFHPTTAPEASTTATSSTAQRPPGVDKRDWAPLTVSLSATCVEHGDELTVTATSTPNAGLGFAVGYSKGENGRVVPDFAYFDHESNPTGTISWAFVIRPSIPYGPGQVKVVANGEDGRGAFQALTIEVAESCG